MIGSEFVMPDPDREKGVEGLAEKLEREDQLEDAIDVFSAPKPFNTAWFVTAAAIGAILVFTFWGVING